MEALTLQLEQAEERIAPDSTHRGPGEINGHPGDEAPNGNTPPPGGKHSGLARELT